MGDRNADLIVLSLVKACIADLLYSYGDLPMEHIAKVKYQLWRPGWIEHNQPKSQHQNLIEYAGQHQLPLTSSIRLKKNYTLCNDGNKSH